MTATTCTQQHHAPAEMVTETMAHIPANARTYANTAGALHHLGAGQAPVAAGVDHHTQRQTGALAKPTRKPHLYVPH